MDILTPEIVPGLIAKGASTRVEADVAPRFQAGDEIVTLNINPSGHTRLPRYLRGKRGVVARDYGVFVFPDTHAHGLGEKPQHLYSVRFTHRELWGDDRSPKDSCMVDVFDDYMEPA